MFRVYTSREEAIEQFASQPAKRYPVTAMKDTISNNETHSHNVNKGGVLIVACVASLITPFMGSAVNIALPSIAAEFSIDAMLLSWIPTAFILASAMFLVPMGKYADIRGRRRVFLWGLCIFTLSSMGCALAPSAPALITIRILQGMGAAMMFGTGTAILISVYPLKDRGRVLGIAVAMVYVGLSIGPFAGGLLTELMGWRSIFWVVIPLCLLAAVLTLRCIRSEWADARGEKFDLAGSLIFSLGLASLMYGFSLMPSRNGGLLLGCGIAGIAGFIIRQLKIPYPVLDMRLFRYNPVFAFSNLSALINYSATFAVTFLMSLFLQYIKGMTPGESGMILVSQPVVMAVFSPLAGRLSDRIEPRLLSSAGMALTALGLVMCGFLDGTSGTAEIVAYLILLGLGFALFSSPNTNAVMSSVERRYYGLASGTVGTMRLTGQMFSMGIAMMILAFHIGRNAITPEYFIQYLNAQQAAFIFFAALCGIGIFTSAIRGRLRNTGEEPAFDRN